jgi:transcriptional regulator with PAS, ATPase and Fis domain
MPQIEWNEVALDAGVRALATLLRRRFGVWVGVTPAGGATIPLGDTSLAGPSFCAPIIANPARISSTSCFDSTEEWATAYDSPQFLRCHAGLSAYVVPLEQLDAALHISGYFDGETAFEQGERARTGLEALGFDEKRDQLVGTVRHLDRADREFVRSVADELAQRMSTAAAEAELEAADTFEEMLGASDVMTQLFADLRRVARSNSTILVQGENGTGKELIARAIHRRSRRRSEPFVVQNCAAIPADLIESELFGHRKGAFSGAHRDRQGLFNAADGGTFFLDEIGDMPLALQVKMLRILQEGTFLPVGDDTFRKVDVRIVCATNRDLEELVESGGFRQDLYYRINVIKLEAPPLRHRREDIPLLARHFAAKSARIHGRSRKSISESALERLLEHTWPGNVRELENEVERAVIMSGDADELSADDFALRPLPQADDFADLRRAGVELPTAIERLERTMILEGLKRTGWNKTQTAKELGISRRNLIRKVAAYELEDQRSS